MLSRANTHTICQRAISARKQVSKVSFSRSGMSCGDDANTRATPEQPGDEAHVVLCHSYECPGVACHTPSISRCRCDLNLNPRHRFLLLLICRSSWILRSTFGVPVAETQLAMRDEDMLYRSHGSDAALGERGMREARRLCRWSHPYCLPTRGIHSFFLPVFGPPFASSPGSRTPHQKSLPSLISHDSNFVFEFCANSTYMSEA